jgi:hypothetical protein
MLWAVIDGRGMNDTIRFHKRRQAEHYLDLLDPFDGSRPRVVNKCWLLCYAATPLVTYHRPYDARLLLLLTIPACSMLWSEGGAVGIAALTVNIVGILSVADVPLAIMCTLGKHVQAHSVGLVGRASALMLFHATPVILLAVGIFYLCVNVRRGSTQDLSVLLVGQGEGNRPQTVPKPELECLPVF